jgi:PAS domain S-box-containing protein
MEGLTLLVAVAFVVVLSIVLQTGIKKSYIGTQMSQIDLVEVTIGKFVEDNATLFVEFMAMPDKREGGKLLRDFSDIYYITPQCIIRAIVKKDEGSNIFPGYDLSRSSVCRFIKEKGSSVPAYSPLIRGPEQEHHSIYLADRVGDQYIVGRIGIGNVHGMLTRIALLTNSVILLATKDGYIITSTGAPLPFSTLNGIAGDEIHLFNTGHLYTRKRSEMLDYDIAIFTPLSQIYIILEWVKWFFIIFIIMISGIIIIKIALQGAYIIRPLENFAALIHNWSASDASMTAPPRFFRYKEIVSLYNAFTERSRQVESVVADLRESEEKFRSMISSMNDIIFVIDEGGRFAFSHAPSPDDFLMRPESFMGRPVAEIMPADVVGKWNLAFEKNRRGEPADFDYSLSMAGETRWFSIKISPILVDISFRGSIAVVRDITERKRAEERALADLSEKEILLKEIHHRVKNNLSVIVSLLNLQSDAIQSGGDAMEAFRESRNRIMSMAMVHEKLYGTNDYSRIDFKEYMEVMVHEIASSYNISKKLELSMNIERIYLDINKAIPCGLIVNELVSNALKHAFPETSSGRIECTLRTLGGGEVVLGVRDNGIGLPDGFDIEAVETLGLKLVQLLAGQISGSLSVESNGGASFSITFKE